LYNVLSDRERTMSFDIDCYPEILSSNYDLAAEDPLKSQKTLTQNLLAPQDVIVLDEQQLKGKELV